MALPKGKSDTMKLIKLSAILALALAMSFTTTGCKKKPTGVTPLPGSRAGTPGGSGPITDINNPINVGDGASGNEQGIPLDGSWSVDDFNQDAAALAAFTVYFAYDSSAVRSGEAGKVESVAGVLSSDTQARLLVQGHCDERGTEEYNRSLGERRALSLREDLVNKGIDPRRIQTISYGEDMPAVDGHDEAAWSMNRRGEFILLRPKM